MDVALTPSAGGQHLSRDKIERGTGSHHGTETIKRLHLTPTHYRFTPDNPKYEPFEIEIEKPPTIRFWGRLSQRCEQVKTLQRKLIPRSLTPVPVPKSG